MNATGKLPEQSAPKGSVRCRTCLYQHAAGLPFAHLISAGIFTLLVSFATVNFIDVALSWVILLCMGAAIGVYLFQQLRRGKEIVFHSHIVAQSPLQVLRRGYLVSLLLAVIGGIALPISLLVYLLTLPLLTLAIIIPLQFLFFPLRGWFYHKTRRHLQALTRAWVATSLTIAFMGMLTVIFLIAAKLVEMHYFTPRELLMIPDEMADHVIAKVEYNIVLIQHLARTMQMFELELLRAYTLADGWIGRLILIYFLLPSTLAAFTLAVMHAGISIVCRGEGVLLEDEHG